MLHVSAVRLPADSTDQTVCEHRAIPEAVRLHDASQLSALFFPALLYLGEQFRFYYFGIEFVSQILSVLQDFSNCPMVPDRLMVCIERSQISEFPCKLVQGSSF